MKETCETKQENGTLKERLLSARYLKTIIFVIVGALAGYLYYYFVGCNSGSCAITSNPVSSILAGSALGYFIINRPCQVC